MKQMILASEFSGSFEKFKSILEGHLAKSESKKVLHIMSAKSHYDNYTPYYERDIKPYEDMGFIVEIYDLANKSKEEVRQKVLSSSIINVMGGNTFVLLQHMKACGFKEILEECFAKDILYVGCSAGTVVMANDINYISEMDDITVATLSDTKGLGFFDTPIVPHVDHSKFNVNAKSITDKFNAQKKDYVSLNDDQYIHVQADTYKMF